MNKDDFRKALSNIGNREPEPAGAKYKAGRIVIAAVASVAVLGAVVAAVLLPTFLKPENPLNNGGEDIGMVAEGTSKEAEAPTPNGFYGEGDPKETEGAKEDLAPDETSTPAITPPPSETGTAAGTATGGHDSVSTPTPGEEPFWFGDVTLSVNLLTYEDVDSTIKTFNSDSLNAHVISTSVFGEHENCENVYYDRETGRVTCLYHELEGIIGEDVLKDWWVFFRHDTVRDDLAAVFMTKRFSITPEKMENAVLLFDINRCTVTELSPPEGVEDFEFLSNYSRTCFRNGKLALNTSFPDGGQCIYIFDAATGGWQKILEDKGLSYIGGWFLDDDLLFVNGDDLNGFYNLSTGVLTEVIGDYCFATRGKVYSVKDYYEKNGPMKVAIYDAVTGEQLEGTVPVPCYFSGSNYSVKLVGTDGTRRTAVTGLNRETECWSKDGAYYYCYSARDENVYCFSVETAEWTSVHVDRISEEPVELDGNLYAVFAGYGMAAEDNCSEVTLYFTRKLELVPELPAYEDDKVDSPYWDVYRSIKFYNFPEKRYFFIADREDMMNSQSGVFNGHDVYFEMDELRDIILKLLEQRTNVYSHARFEHSTFSLYRIYINCGSLEIAFGEDDGGLYKAYIGYKGNAIEGYIAEVCNVPESLFNEAVKLHPVHTVLKIYPEANKFYNEESDCDMILPVAPTEEDSEYLLGILNSGRWQPDDTMNLSFSHIFLNGDKEIYYLDANGLFRNVKERVFIKVTEEERLFINELLEKYNNA